MQAEYLKNIETGLVFPATKILMKEAARYGHLVPCDEDGNLTARVQDEQTDLEAENARLKEQVQQLQAEIDMLKDETPEEVTEVKLEDDEPPEANRMQALVNAIGELEQGHPDHFVQSGKRAGKPRVEVLEAFAGIVEVSAAEADEAWDRFNA